MNITHNIEQSVKGYAERGIKGLNARYSMLYDMNVYEKCYISIEHEDIVYNNKITKIPILNIEITNLNPMIFINDTYKINYIDITRLTRKDEYPIYSCVKFIFTDGKFREYVEKLSIPPYGNDKRKIKLKSREIKSYDNSEKLVTSYIRKGPGVTDYLLQNKAKKTIYTFEEYIEIDKNMQLFNTDGVNTSINDILAVTNLIGDQDDRTNIFMEGKQKYVTTILADIENIDLGILMSFNELFKIIKLTEQTLKQKKIQGVEDNNTSTENTESTKDTKVEKYEVMQYLFNYGRTNNNYDNKNLYNYRDTKIKRYTKISELTEQEIEENRRKTYYELYDINCAHYSNSDVVISGLLVMYRPLELTRHLQLCGYTRKPSVVELGTIDGVERIRLKDRNEMDSFLNCIEEVNGKDYEVLLTQLNLNKVHLLSYVRVRFQRELLPVYEDIIYNVRDYILKQFETLHSDGIDVKSATTLLSKLTLNQSRLNDINEFTTWYVDNLIEDEVNKINEKEVYNTSSRRLLDSGAHMYNNYIDIIKKVMRFTKELIHGDLFPIDVVTENHKQKLQEVYNKIIDATTPFGEAANFVICDDEDSNRYENRLEDYCHYEYLRLIENILIENGYIDHNNNILIGTVEKPTTDHSTWTTQSKPEK